MKHVRQGNQIYNLDMRFCLLSAGYSEYLQLNCSLKPGTLLNQPLTLYKLVPTSPYDQVETHSYGEMSLSKSPLKRVLCPLTPEKTF